MKILIVGTGYVGLVTGACFAQMGHSVVCLDIDHNKIEQLNRGVIPFYEPGLEELVVANCAACRLRFTTDYASAVAHAEICFLAVATPQAEDGSADTTFVWQAAAQIAAVMDGYKIIVNKSTVPVGSVETVAQIIQKGLESRHLSLSFDVVSNPEFLKEGNAIADFISPDRVVIGAKSSKVIDTMRELYAPFNLEPGRFLVMDPASAEMTKYAANALLAARISLMNELSWLCEHLGADITQVRKGVGADPRIGYEFLHAGAGYGGSCFPKDVQALVAQGRNLGEETPLLEAVEEVNRRQKHVLGKKIDSYFNGRVTNKTIAIWGLAFKPGTDDMREAPALVVIRDLLSGGASLRLFDPIAMKRSQEILKKTPSIHWCRDPYEAVTGADAIVLVTEWGEFRSIDFTKVLSLMRGRAFFDGRNLYSPSEMIDLGFDYFSIGRPLLQAAIFKR